MADEYPGTSLVPVQEVSARVDLGVVRADRPAELVQRATEAADALASVIESRKLFSNIQGKKFVRCEGWTTLAAMLGVTPHEIGVTETAEGAFTATVELRRLTDGAPVSRASAECGPDEPTWKGRARYARRSMALTRATAKACRLAFSWIMALSGYEVTPAEEMAHDDARGGAPRSAGPAPSKAEAAAPTRTESLDDKPASIAAAEKEPMPWDNLEPPTDPLWRQQWPFGSLKGRELWTLSSEEIAQQLKWSEKVGKAEALQPTMRAILTARGGVV